MTLSDQVAAMEAENVALKADCNTLREKVAKREGEILGNRRHMGAQDKILQRQAAHISTLEGHLRTVHGSLQGVAAQRENVRQAREEAPKTPVQEAKEIALRISEPPTVEETREVRSIAERLRAVIPGANGTGKAA